MSNVAHAERKLEHAKLFLERLRAENARVVGKNRIALEADLSACVGALQAAIFRLERKVGEPTYSRTLAQWKGTLAAGSARKRANHMLKNLKAVRGLDVHVEDIETTTASFAVAMRPPTRGWIWVPEEAMVRDPTGGSGAAAAWFMGEKLMFEGFEASETCARYLDLVEQLVASFRQGYALTARTRRRANRIYPDGGSTA